MLIFILILLVKSTDFEYLKKSKDLIDIIEYTESNDCMKNTIDQFEHKCKNLDDFQKRHLALKFTNCFLENSGKPQIICDNSDIKSCTGRLKEVQFSKFTLYYLHIDNLCYYYKSLNWQQDTEFLINNLTQNSKISNEALMKSVSVNEDLMSVQKLMNKELVQNIKENQNNNQKIQELFQNLEKRNNKINNEFDKLQLKIDSQVNIFNIFSEHVNQSLSDLKYLQYYLIGEYFDFKQLLYFSGLILTIHFMTSLQKLQQAKFLVYIIILINFLIERFICCQNFIEDPLQKSSFIYGIRLLFNTLVILNLYNQYNDFKDYSQMAYQEIKKLSNSIKSHLISPQKKMSVKECLNSALGSLVNSQKKQKKQKKSVSFQEKKNETIVYHVDNLKRTNPLKYLKGKEKQKLKELEKLYKQNKRINQHNPLQATINTNIQNRDQINNSNRTSLSNSPNSINYETNNGNVNSAERIIDVNSMLRPQYIKRTSYVSPNQQATPDQSPIRNLTQNFPVRSPLRRSIRSPIDEQNQNRSPLRQSSPINELNQDKSPVQINTQIYNYTNNTMFICSPLRNQKKQQ